MTKSSPDKTPTHAGHRGRLLERYLTAGIESLADYEIIELLLTYVLPRRDTKQIAKTLLTKFGTISGVINAPLDDLHEKGGLTKRTAALFSLVKDTMAFCLKESFEKKEQLSDREKIEDYLRFKYGHCRYEYAAAIFLDGDNRALGTEIVAEGTVNKTAVYPRKVIETALKYGASAIILAHNHPAGTHTPSESDWDLTEKLQNAGKGLDIRLVDHLIISKDTVVSMREFERWWSIDV